VFSSGLLKAENPKFPGCFFIGNIYNTLKKLFPETDLDEVQLVQQTYNNSKYYVHLSREMVKTQIKYLGENVKSPLSYLKESPTSLFRESPIYVREISSSSSSSSSSSMSVRESPTKSPIALLRESPSEEGGKKTPTKSPIALLKESPRDSLAPEEIIEPSDDQWDSVLQKTVLPQKKKGKFGAIGEKMKVSKKKKVKDEDIDLVKLEKTISSMTFDEK